MRVILVRVHIPTSWRGRVIPEGMRRQLYEVLNTIAAKTSVGWVVLVPPNDPMFKALQVLADKISVRVSEAVRSGLIPHNVSPVTIMAADLNDDLLRHDLTRWAEHLHKKIEEYSKKTYPTAMLRIAEARRALELIHQFMRRLGASIPTASPSSTTPQSPIMLSVEGLESSEGDEVPEVPEFMNLEG